MAHSNVAGFDKVATAAEQRSRAYEMDGLAGYGATDSDDGADDQHAEKEVHSDSEDSSDSSLDSAAIRAAEAEAKLKDFGKEKAMQPTALPSAFSAFDEVDGPPQFLDPEATRPLAAPLSHGRSGLAAHDAAGSGPSAPGRMKPGAGFDISLLAPKLKGQKRQTTDPRDMPASAVIEGKAKRYKTDEGVEATQQYTAAQIAMLGGNVSDKAPRVASKPMEVAEFLGKGIGAAQLPRKAQDRRDKEKEKRTKGQSAIGSWKTEAEMVLRQQFDS